jgi:hypothetical protein
MTDLHPLPAPLPLLVAKCLPDLKALDALRRASSLFAAVFALHAAKLLEHLMQASLREDVMLEIRAHVLLLVDLTRWRGTDDAMELLHEEARSPLDRNVPVEAVSLALLRFTEFHSLFVQVATEKLEELYALPHVRPQQRGTREYGESFSVFYGVPAPTSPHWVEEQGGLKVLFHLGSCRLLGQEPEWPKDKPRFSLVQETRELFETYLHDDSRPCSLTWNALALPPRAINDFDERWSWDMTHPDGSTKGWQTFFIMCCYARHGPYSRYDTEGYWPVFRKLGMALWSHRRLAEELELVLYPMTKDELIRHNNLPPGERPKRMSREGIAFTWWALSEPYRIRST